MARWDDFPLARQQDLFSAAVLHALEVRAVEATCCCCCSMSASATGRMVCRGRPKMSSWRRSPLPTQGAHCPSLPTCCRGGGRLWRLTWCWSCQRGAELAAPHSDSTRQSWLKEGGAAWHAMALAASPPAGRPCHACMWKDGVCSPAPTSKHHQGGSHLRSHACAFGPCTAKQ